MPFEARGVGSYGTPCIVFTYVNCVYNCDIVSIRC